METVNTKLPMPLILLGCGMLLAGVLAITRGLVAHGVYYDMIWLKIADLVWRLRGGLLLVGLGIACFVVAMVTATITYRR